ncbi:molybdopterin-containing oxidoreductase family protein [Stakelama tenebrarum]|uniref:Molybdopterin-dependent oxidoreductase n=1 Tax=Stakelama tenebrarum TaxID=2711215 RepID=A0A6G6Y727_9SPHN|nr:molybdopterin-dependent oxidoreductase [Sphingosinithalassobacter tenebrarum]QIG80742.1 molybdopterin-dependent oxidoreductase [Sphingosinithalassobacter tenebrarum]
MQRKVKSFCRNCSALCAMELTVEDDRLTGVAPDGSVAPGGAYICPKGLAAVEFHNGAEDRLTTSLKRDGSGNFAPIAVDRAMDEIADAIAALVAEHGPRAIAFYHGTGAYRAALGGLMERAMCSALGTPNFFSTMTIDQSAKWVTMGRMGVMASGKPRLPDVDLAVIVGNNPMVSHQAFPFIAGESKAPGRAFEAARARGMKMIVIDPRRTETARFADLLIQPLPGQDVAIFAAIAHILLRDETWNRAFCDRFASQIAQLREAVAPFTPELAAERADVPVEQIEEAAAMIGAAKRPLVGSGSGPSFADHSNLADHMIEAVNALVGGYRRAGDLVRNPGTLKPRPAIETAIAPTRSWERGPKCRTRDIGHLMGEFPTALLPDEILTPGPDKIRALIVLGGNPLMGLGDPARSVPAFEALDLLVCLDARLNETGRHADYVIATAQPFERHDITVAGDAAFPEPFVQYAPPAVPPPDGVIDDWEFYWGVSARMGLPLTFKHWGYGQNYDAIERGLPLPTDPAAKPPSESLIEFLCDEGDVTFEALQASPAGVRPERPPQYVRAMDDNGARLELCPPDVATELAEVLRETPETGFAFRLTSRRVLEAMNGAYRDSKRMARRYPVNWAYLNPDDMADLSIEDGATIEIESGHGLVRGIAKGEDRLRRGVVSMTHFFGVIGPSRDPVAERGSYTGRLTSLDDHIQAINFMPRFSAVPVNLRPVSALQG